MNTAMVAMRRPRKSAFITTGRDLQQHCMKNPFTFIVISIQNSVESLSPDDGIMQFHTCACEYRALLEETRHFECCVVLS
jgi:hypothetical protein